MTEQDKELLLKDLCGRLYTNTVVNYNGIEGCDYPLTIRTLSNFPEEELKCYLRPMSSMTEEEKKEYELLANHCIVTSMGFIHLEAASLVDWLNKNKFDYRGLIPKGLALESPEGMYND